jgi:cobalt-zinc-cadmium efflux system protein
VGSWAVTRDAVGILMEAAPRGVSLVQVEQAMRAVPGVCGVHDLHIWSLTAGVPAVSGHVLVQSAGESQRVLRDLGTLLSTRFGLNHVTLQVETGEFAESWHPRCAPGANPHPAS